MKITKRDMAVLSAYTGIMFGEFPELHKYLEELKGRPVYTHEMAFMEEEARELSKKDFLELESRMRKEAYKE